MAIGSTEEAEVSPRGGRDAEGREKEEYGVENRDLENEGCQSRAWKLSYGVTVVTVVEGGGGGKKAEHLVPSHAAVPGSSIPLSQSQ